MDFFRLDGRIVVRPEEGVQRERGVWPGRIGGRRRLDIGQVVFLYEADAAIWRADGEKAVGGDGIKPKRIVVWKTRREERCFKAVQFQRQPRQFQQKLLERFLLGTI